MKVTLWEQSEEDLNGREKKELKCAIQSKKNGVVFRNVINNQTRTQISGLFSIFFFSHCYPFISDVLKKEKPEIWYVCIISAFIWSILVHCYTAHIIFIELNL